MRTIQGFEPDLFADPVLAALRDGQPVAAPGVGVDATIYGTSGDDHLKGTSGGDYIDGGGGNDTILGLGGADSITGGAGDDSLDGGDGADYITDSGGGNDSLYGGAGNDGLGISHEFVPLPGTTDHVLLDGGAGDDILNVSAGSLYGPGYQTDATVLGGTGDDIIWVIDAQHVSIDAGAGNDTLDLVVGQDQTVTLGAGADLINPMAVEAGADGLVATVFTDFQTGDGGDQIALRTWLGQLFTGTDGSNPFGDGHVRLVQDGADTVLQADLNGGGDNWIAFMVFQNTSPAAFSAFNFEGYATDGSDPAGEVFTGTAGGDFLQGGLGMDTLIGLAGDDTLDGGDAADRLNGGAGDDILNGGAGKDTLIGGKGNDQLGGGGFDLMIGGAGDDTLGASYGTDETGHATLEAGGGDDAIYVGFYHAPGAVVTAIGGSGDDLFTVNGAGHAVLEGGSGNDRFDLTDPGTDAVLSLGDGADVVRLEPGTGQAVTVTITDFQAGDGGDRLDLFDFLFQDLTSWDRSTNPFAAGYLRLVEHGQDAHLQISVAGDGTWSDFFVLRGVDAAELTAANLGGYPPDGSAPAGEMLKGTARADDLTGGFGPDTLSGGDGDDTLDGGSGDDRLSGGKGADLLTGGYGSDVVNGGAGDDRIYDYLNGADTLIGGGGDDQIDIYREFETPGVGTIVVHGGGGADAITVNGGGPTAGQLAQVTGDAGDDSISVYNFTAATIAGGTGDDTISVGDEHYVIDAGAGDDTVNLRGGSAGIRITLGDGADTVAFQNFIIPGVAAEVADFTGQDKVAIQSLVNGALWGSGGDPFGKRFLRLAQEGSDTVLQVSDGHGVVWSDLLKLDQVTAADLTTAQLDGYDPGAIWRVGTAGADHLSAGGGINALDGAGGADQLTGSGAADTLVGGDGADTLTGGGGADSFRFDALADSTAAAHDLIADLTDSDVIDLSRVDANAQLSGDQSFVLVDHFDGHAQELTLSYDAGSNTTLVEGDVDGDGTADLVIALKGDHSGFTNFVL